MQRDGAILAILIFLGTFGLSQAAEARGFFQTVFGFGQEEQSSQTYLAPPRPLRHHHATNATRTRKHLIAHDVWRKFAHKHPHVAAHQKKLHHRAAVQSVSASPQESPPTSSARPCCSNAQEAINQIINNDPTLRPGDAYMSNEGLRVYVGERMKNSEFVPVEHAHHIDAGLKQRLAAVSKPPLKGFARTSPDNAKDRRQIAESQRASAHDKPHNENMVDGPQGRLIRFVGGFAN